jgi:hypothetical protein
LYDAELIHSPFLLASGWLINWRTRTNKFNLQEEKKEEEMKLE